MQAKLVVLQPDTQPNEYNITLPVTIGRGSEAELKLVHALVSRQHCELFLEQGHMMVRDLGSLNGTFVGGQRIETAPLMPGELLTVGSVTLRVMYGNEPASEAMEGAPMHQGQVMVAAVDTISLEDTCQGSQPEDDDDFDEPMNQDGDDPKNFFRNMN
jgi:predicted component of type VI protein secretion system